MSKFSMWIPPIVGKIKKRLNLKNELYYFNEYETWEDALRESDIYGGNYSNSAILKQVSEATQLVRSGKALYEQDGICFYETNYNYELLAAMLYVKSSLKDSEFNVIDFGGALGSTFFRYRKIWESIEAKWTVVEQQHYVSYGKTNVPEIDFQYTVAEAFKTLRGPSILLLSSVLMYLDSPYTMLKQILEYNFDYIVIDETAFMPNESDKDTIMLQHVPARIYNAVYPLHLLGLNEFKDRLDSMGYSVIWEWDYHGGGIPIKKGIGLVDTIEKGFLLKKA